jgi:UDP:flavonoid glycosyltransferase YjiC (YdhE family)
LAQELRSRGHEVIFAGKSSKIKFIQEHEFEVLPIYEPDPVMLLGNIRDNKIKFISDADIEMMIAADIALYREQKPDIVLTDFRYTAPISTQIMGIKHIAIVNASSTEYRALPYIPLFEWIPERLMDRDAKLWEILDSLNLRIEMSIFDNVMNVFKKLSKKYKLQKIITATNCLTGKDLTLLADIPEYFPTKNLPDNYHYIGPLTWQSNIPPPHWWPPERNNKPFIYITMGTTGFPDFFHKVCELFKTSEMRAIITTGEQVKDLNSIAGKIFVEPFIDGDMVTEACDLVVCHGGNGTIYQALKHGKPVIGIPTVPDQQFNMRRVKALGIGETLTWNDFKKNPQLLIDLVRSVINDTSYYDNVKKLSEVLLKYDAVKTGADIITRMGKS